MRSVTAVPAEVIVTSLIFVASSAGRGRTRGPILMKIHALTFCLLLAPAAARAQIPDKPVVVFQPSHQKDTGERYNEALTADAMADYAMRTPPFYDEHKVWSYFQPGLHHAPHPVRFARHGSLRRSIRRVEQVLGVKARRQRAAEGEAQRQVEHAPGALDHVGERRIAGRVNAVAHLVEEHRRARRPIVADPRQAGVQHVRRLAHHSTREVGGAGLRVRGQFDAALHHRHVREDLQRRERVGDERQ